MILKVFKNSIKFLIKQRMLPEKPFEEPFWLDRCDAQKLLELKDKYKGERCFIIGNGPSLNKIDLSLLAGSYSFGVNSIFLKTLSDNFMPSFYTVEDSHVMTDNKNEINEYGANVKFIPTEYKSLVTNKKNVVFYNMNCGFYQPYSPNYEVPRFSKAADERLYCGQSVTIINLQLAYYMGFSEVFLIGMDFTYDIPDSAVIDGDTILSTEDDPNHFDPSYFGAGKKWHDPKLHNVLESYRLCKQVYEADSRKIFNATVGGRLELFDRVEFNELF